MDIKSVNYQTDTGFTLFQKNKNQANLEALAEEFESMFINQMLKQARDSKLSDALFSSDEEDNFGTMLGHLVAILDVYAKTCKKHRQINDFH